MRIVHSAEEMPKEYAEARDESKKAFGDDQIFVEKYLRVSKTYRRFRSLVISMDILFIYMTVTALCTEKISEAVEYAPAFSIT